MARFLLILLICSPVCAATYYVAPNGSNHNEGTIDRPLATITFGLTKLSGPGDALVVRGGVYRETVNVWRRNGDASHPIEIRGAENEKPVIDGTGKRANAVVTLLESSFVTFSGFEVRNGAHTGILVFDSHDVSVQWNNVHDCRANGIGVVSKRPDRSHDVLIQGNTVTRCVLSNIARNRKKGWVQAISAYASTRVTIVKNYVHENFGEGIDYILSDHGTIAGNRVWDNFSANIYLDNARNTVVDGNFLTSGWVPNATQYYRDGAPGGGIVTANEFYPFQRPLDGITITNNIVVRTGSGFVYGGWERGGGLHHTLVAFNTFVDTDGPVLTIAPAAHDTTTIANNIFVQRNGAPVAEAPKSGITFRTNAWSGGTAPVAGAGDITADPQFVATRTGTPDDYRLQASSPLRNAAMPLAEVTKDFTGAARRGRTIGAFD